MNSSSLCHVSERHNKSSISRVKRSFREKDLFAIDLAFNRPIWKVDDATEAVTAERSKIGGRHVQRSRELQLDRAETGVNTEERGGDEGH